MQKKRLVLIVGILALIGVALSDVGAPVQNTLSGAMRPLWLLGSKVGDTTALFTSTLFGIPYNVQEIRALRMERAELRARIASLEEIRRENIVLKEMIHAHSDDTSLIYTQVMGRSISGIRDTLVLAGGSESGIEEGMIVLARGNIHLGFVRGVTAQSARVELLSDPGAKTEIYMPESGVSSVAEGIGLGVVTIKVPTSIAIREGEPIFSTGRKDLLVGYVDTIERADASAFQLIKTKAPLYLYDVRNVFLIRA